MTHLSVRSLCIALAALFLVMPVTAQDSVLVAKGELVKKSKSLSGSFLLKKVGEGYVLELADNFKAKSGPDLKVVLSPLSLAAVNGKTALSRGSVVLAPLKKNKGAQSYAVPAGTDLGKFKSVLIHCEKYAVLWGGGKLGE